MANVTILQVADMRPRHCRTLTLLKVYSDTGHGEAP